MPNSDPSRGRLVLNRLAPAEEDAAARLIHGALTDWYAQHLNQPGRFGAAWEPFRIFPAVYESLDPGCAVAARDGTSDKLLGLCFYHPRPSHVSVGIVATLPEAGRRGVARAMLGEVFALAGAAGKPVRLVSSLMNLDSFSLYTRLGFVPGTVFQDLQFPPGVLPVLLAARGVIRPAVPADVTAIVALEQSLTGLDRGQDFRFFCQERAPTLAYPGADRAGWGVARISRIPASPGDANDRTGADAG